MVARNPANEYIHELLDALQNLSVVAHESSADLYMDINDLPDEFYDTADQINVEFEQDVLAVIDSINNSVRELFKEA